MSEQTITVTAETETELSPKDLSRAIGDQLIGQRSARPFAYLAGIAMDGMAGHKDLPGVLIEYIDNEASLDLTDDEQRAVEDILRDAYDR